MRRNGVHPSPNIIERVSRFPPISGRGRKAVKSTVLDPSSQIIGADEMVTHDEEQTGCKPVCQLDEYSPSGGKRRGASGFQRHNGRLQGDQKSLREDWADRGRNSSSSDE